MITKNFIDENHIQIGSLSALYDADVVGFSTKIYLTVHIFLLYLASCLLLSSIKKPVDKLIDNDGNLIEILESFQITVKKIYDRSGMPGLIMTKLNRFLLRKTHEKYALIITNINEHDADIEIKHGLVSNQFTHASDLINHLNS